VKIDSVPAPARAAIQKAAGAGAVKKIEAVTENGKTFYEASLSKNGKASEFQVDAGGAKVK
jgi:uncharacterized membrane protein YkoI